MLKLLLCTLSRFIILNIARNLAKQIEDNNRSQLSMSDGSPRAL